MKKRIFCTMLALLLVCSLCPAPAFAQGNYTDLGPLRVTYNGDVYTACGWLNADGHVCLPARAAELLLGYKPAGVYIDGKKYADMTQNTDSCVYDETLNSVYIWNGLPAEPIISAPLYPEFGEPLDEPISYREFFAMLDTAVELADPSKLSGWRAQLPEARTSQRIMTRVEGMYALLYAAAALGGEYSEFNTDWSTLNSKIGESCWSEIDSIYERHDPNDLIPNPDQYNLGGFTKADYIYDGWDMKSVAYRYSFGRCSVITGQTMFDYDPARNSMRLADDFTRQEAVTALSRFLDSAPEKADAEIVSVDDPQVVQYDASILTPEILTAASNMPSLTGEDRPVWNGAVLGGSYEQTEIDVGAFSLDARKLSEYGFNCARYMLVYDLLFDRSVDTANLTNLRKLDAIIAWASRYRIHLNLVTITVPGRWSVTDNYSSVGEFDLFTNEERQAEVRRMWSLLAERYRDVPSSVLSFQPIWECSNTNLSTGLPADPYTFEDVAKVYADLTRSIRNCDPDRFILYEPTANNAWEDTIREAEAVKTAMEQFDNVQLLTNFCEMPYVYSEMTAVEGEHIDFNNHAMFKPGYPVTYYSVQCYISQQAPLVLGGGIPAGTQLNFYISETEGGGTLTVAADGTTLYSETLAAAAYRTDDPLSGYFPYAKSDKKVSVTLETEAQSLSITFDGTQLNWSGMDVLLPEAYAVERWWYPSAYDQFLEGEEGQLVIEKKPTSNIQISPNSSTPVEITIHADSVSYTTGQIAAQSSRETIERWGQEISAFAPGSATRIERAAFCLGTEYASALDYYGDVLDMCSACGLGWFTNDYSFYEIFLPYYTEGSSAWNYAGSEYVQCADGMVLREMMQLYQEHMLPPQALPEAAEEAGVSFVGGWNAVPGGVELTVNLGYYKSDEAQLFCAFYDGSGKLLSVSAAAAAPGEQEHLFQGPASSRSAASFLLNSTSAPLCPSAKISNSQRP